MKFCPFCGKPLSNPEAKFCSECGKPLTQLITQQAEPVPPPAPPPVIDENPTIVYRPQDHLISEAPAAPRYQEQPAEAPPTQPTRYQRPTPQPAQPQRKKPKKPKKPVEEPIIRKAPPPITQRPQEQAPPAPQWQDEDDGYDGYYDDVLPNDEDEIEEGIDSDLVKQIVLILLLMSVVIALCVAALYLL